MPAPPAVAMENEQTSLYQSPECVTGTFLFDLLCQWPGTHHATFRVLGSGHFSVLAQLASRLPYLLCSQTANDGALRGVYRNTLLRMQHGCRALRPERQTGDSGVLHYMTMRETNDED